MQHLLWTTSRVQRCSFIVTCLRLHLRCHLKSVYTGVRAQSSILYFKHSSCVFSAPSSSILFAGDCTPGVWLPLQLISGPTRRFSGVPEYILQGYSKIICSFKDVFLTTSCLFFCYFTYNKDELGWVTNAFRFLKQTPPRLWLKSLL